MLQSLLEYEACKILALGLVGAFLLSAIRNSFPVRRFQFTSHEVRTYTSSISRKTMSCSSW